MLNKPISVVMLGASGAVGGIVAGHLMQMPEVGQLTLLNRRALDGFKQTKVQQHTVNIFEISSYAQLLPGHDVAICCLGVGQPSKVSKEELVRVDQTAVLAFAAACKAAGVRHFELLSSVGADAHSASFYLRTKGALQNGVVALGFERVSFFQPSVILTSHNRYGWSQGMLLALWPMVSKVLVGPLRRYRGVPVERLGQAMAINIVQPGQGVETMQWDEIMSAAKRSHR
jgi:uncharacterized protein YbjT (DUF2867 family)